MTQTTRPTISLELKDISIPAERQRKDFKGIKELADSIAQRGLINPIVIDDDNNLIAGERRLKAHEHLGRTHIETRKFSDLTAIDRVILEYDENIQREKLSWQEETRAVVAIHNCLCEEDADWTKQKTADRIGSSVSTISQAILIVNELEAGNEKVVNAPTKKQARNITIRARERSMKDTISKIGEAQLTIDANAIQPPLIAGGTIEPSTSEPAATPHHSPILAANFIDWASTYTGQKFNMLHCDLPYGIDHGASDQGGAAVHGGYDDSEENYWNLCKAIADNLDRLVLPSAHMIFWFSMEFYEETIEFFHSKTDFKLATKKPLIWHKSDNRGVVADVTRRPRHIYETALFFSRGDRKIIEPVADVYSARTTKESHLSEKPQQMLEHFFRLCVDGLSHVLDPTCGSGSALRAASARGAARVQGIEANEEYADIARNRYNREQSLAKAAAIVNGDNNA